MKTGSLTPNDLHHTVLTKHNWSSDLEHLLRFYSQCDYDEQADFDEHIHSYDDHLSSLWQLLQEMGIGIRPIGFEFFVQDQKEEEED